LALGVREVDRTAGGAAPIGAYVRHDAHDFAIERCSHGTHERNVTPHRVLVGEVAFDERLVDHHGFGSRGGIPIVELTAGAQRNPQRTEVAGADRFERGTGKSLFARLITFPLDAATPTGAAVWPAIARGHAALLGKRGETLQ